MAGKLKLDVAVPERQMLSKEVDEVQVPGADGYLGILPGHAPLMTQLGSGVLSYNAAGKTRYLALTGGVMEVLPDHVRILADTAEWANEVDIKRAEQARRRANDMLQSHKLLKIDAGRATLAIRRAEARLEATKRHQAG